MNVKNITQPPKKNYIKASLILKGIKITDIARELGVTQGAVSRVIAGNLRSKRIQERIAELLNEEPAVLFSHFNNKENQGKSKCQKGKDF